VTVRRAVDDAFAQGRPALITYLMAGYPDRAGSVASIRAAAEAGADLIELGVPYGDPLADGPAIVEAASAARAAAPGGFGLAETLILAAELTGDPAMAPLVVMTYLNPMLRFGLPLLAQEAARAGVAGFIVPDLPADGPFADRWIQEARASGLSTIFLAAPTSTADRLVAITSASTGFVYCVSAVGVTGERATVSDGLPGFLGRVRAALGSGTTPIAVGFGISTPEQAAQVAAIADGVVVGSAVVKRQRDPERVREFVAETASAVHGAR
jgi:tryptophan synthase alpha chain